MYLRQEESRLRYAAASVATSLLVGLGNITALQAVPILSQPHFLVSDYRQGNILRYDLAGTFIDEFAFGLGTSAEMDIGPDGKLYVASSTARALLQFDPTNGQALGQIRIDGASPRGFTWGPNGNLFVASGRGVAQVDATSGEFLGSFTTLDHSVAAQFGFDGNLYVAFGLLGDPSGISRFNGQTGSFIDVFATETIALPTDLLLAPNGDFYVANQSTNFPYKVVRLNRDTALRWC